MAKLWLPIKDEQTGRAQILYIPGASHMDRSHLEEIIAWQKERTIAKMREKGALPPRKYSRKEVGRALRDFRESLKRRRESGNPRYF